MPDPAPPALEFLPSTPSPRKPKLGVFVILAAVNFTGIFAGFQVWDFLGQPGKDPAAELRQCGPFGLAVSAIIYAIYFRRTWRLTLIALVVAFALGAITGLSAVVWHIQQHGWH
jgi:hypothetical protein